MFLKGFLCKGSPSEDVSHRVNHRRVFICFLLFFIVYFEKRKKP